MLNPTVSDDLYDYLLAKIIENISHLRAHHQIGYSGVYMRIIYEFKRLAIHSHVGTWCLGNCIPDSTQAIADALGGARTAYRLAGFNRPDNTTNILDTLRFERTSVEDYFKNSPVVALDNDCRDALRGWLVSMLLWLLVDINTALADTANIKPVL